MADRQWKFQTAYHSKVSGRLKVGKPMIPDGLSDGFYR
ncbi:hypothetical protein l11_01550 [Neisseria weaveri LMG 5135]|nr:hypothetical protein l13_11420 [Neisseria weaveri ATCC 51223]EGV38708.1 hypothetical protein l11_01550 [Neisseria weaveri LMG 5135]